MKAYGDKRTAGYGEITGKPSCRCCNGSYAKIGRSANKHNAMRGLKKDARRASKSEVLEGLHEFEMLEEDKECWDERAEPTMEDYNFDLTYIFKEILIQIAPELAWCDAEPSWDNDYNARALSKLPWKMRSYSPKHPEEYTELLEKILGARP